MADRPEDQPEGGREPLPSLSDLSERYVRLQTMADMKVREYAAARSRLAEGESFLAMAPQAAETIETLSKALFGEILDEIEDTLTHAIREVLGQDRTVTSLREVKGNRLTVHFEIRNRGIEENVEDILCGQGGSVCNIMSVGLRLVALSQLDPARHRPFLVLDEQDCWLRPQLVPRFMRLVASIAERLGLQVLVISHHPVDLFAEYAGTIHALRPDPKLGAVLEVMKAETADDVRADGEGAPPVLNGDSEPGGE